MGLRGSAAFQPAICGLSLSDSLPLSFPFLSLVGGKVPSRGLGGQNPAASFVSPRESGLTVKKSCS